jgi:hypothetical protein
MKRSRTKSSRRRREVHIHFGPELKELYGKEILRLAQRLRVLALQKIEEEDRLEKQGIHDLER